MVALSRVAMAEARSAGLQGREDGERDLGADALHRLQQPEPLPLDIGEEPEQADLILAHMGLDGEVDRLARRRQRLQGARRTMHEIADAMDVEDDEILAIAVDHALKLADHLSLPIILQP